MNLRSPIGKHLRLLSRAALACLAAAAGADTVRLPERSVEGEVRSVTADAVQMADGTSLPLGQVRGIVRSASDVVSYPAGVILTNGTQLGGRIRAMGLERIAFQSVSLGPLEFPLSAVARLYLDRDDPWRAIPAPAAGRVRLVLRNGTSREGTLFAASPGQIVLRSGDNLEKVDFAALSAIVFRPAAAPADLRLRNGDRLAGPAAGAGSRIDVFVGEKKLSLGIDSVKDWEFKEMPEERKE